MKKVLVGCAVFLGLAVLGLGGSLWYLGRTMSNVAGDLITATQTAMKMTLDRMEQEAVTVPAADFAAKLSTLVGQPVRVSGRVMRPVDAKGAAPPGINENQVLFLEPMVIVMATNPDVLPARRTEGVEVEVLGIASRLNLSALPGMDEKALADIKEKLGGADLPVVVARRVSAVKPAEAAPR